MEIICNSRNNNTNAFTPFPFQRFSIFQIPTRFNAYETCGPVTNYVWSFKRVIFFDRLIVDEERLLPPCIGKFNLLHLKEYWNKLIFTLTSNVTLYCCFSEQFFPDFKLNADSLYFVNACKQLTEEDKFIVRVAVEFLIILS